MLTHDQNSHVAQSTPVVVSKAGTANLHARLLRIVSSSEDAAQVRSNIRQAVRDTTSASEVAHVTRDAHGQWVTDGGQTESSLDVSAKFINELREVAQAALDRGATQIQRLSEQNTIHMVCAPVSAPGVAGEVLVALFRAERSNLHSGLYALELAGSYQKLWAQANTTDAAQWKLNSLAAIIELVSMAEQQDDVRAAAQAIADQLGKFLACDRVAIAYRHSRGLRLTAVSGMPNFDANSETCHLMREALAECLLREQVTCWPASDDETTQPNLAHRELARQARLQSVLTAPLCTPSGTTIGAWLFADRGDLLQKDRLRSFVHAASPRVAGALDVVVRSKQGKVKCLVNAGRRVFRSRRGIVTTIVMASLLTAMLIPWPYRVRCRCVIEPISRRYAVAPFDGLIEQGFVEPGDEVATGDLLARMDGREIRWELSGERAKRGQMAKKRDMELTQRHVPEALIAQLETERLDARLALLGDRAAHLEVRSAVDGVVLSGSLEKAQSAPVKMGQVLYEIGPLEKLKVEMEIPAVDVGQIQTGQPVKVWIEGLERAPLTGIVGHLRPRSQLRDQRNVFIAELAFPNEEHLFRPGMRGSARITGPMRPLGWNLFHKPWYYVVSRIAWW